ncbi:hypothetical protein AA12717_2674 [Gluconacetobacter sacchari DSM 12717]|uniref:Uncharacterized protein n=1 Tax=Gluconacetobacter sacchari DSM 12717 TaxID=1307940 RepID=A0ABQ0P9G5_9PROT|nr:hypothetical protein AA12717_2674 [Gluconacetobacter sacchari DSM 12717]
MSINLLPTERAAIHHEGVECGETLADQLRYAITATLGPLNPQPDVQEVGAICFGDVQPTAAAKKVQETFAEKARVSPIDFVNANPGASLSIVCTELQLRGPTLHFLMGGDAVRETALILAFRWTTEESAEVVVVAEITMVNGRRALDITLVRRRGHNIREVFIYG